MSLRDSRAVAVAFVSFAAFTDLVAYSIAVPVLPDLSRRLGASPTTIGFLFASFGVTLLGVSVPIGSVSDRMGRKTPLVGGMIVLAGSTLLFAFADSLAWLFAARLAQGAADAVTWVVGFALIADLYGPAERGRVMGFVMSGTSLGLMIGPSLGGWLYETGGMRLPFLAVAGFAMAATIGFAWLRLPSVQAEREAVPLGQLLRVPAVATCALTVVVAASTAAMLEPAISLWLSSDLGLNPARIGIVFGVAAVAATALHPVFGRFADRYGGRRMTMIGLVLTALLMPVVSRATSFESAAALYLLLGSAIALVVTPSLAFMAEATSAAGVTSFGVSYGVYNFAWGIGLLSGPAIGGFLFERLGFARLTLMWMPFVLVTSLLLILKADTAISRAGR
jgi:MFS transporter, DHA1 family, solute carrier family 18 (vesicular amine transporter), member 1/2